MNISKFCTIAFAAAVTITAPALALNTTFAQFTQQSAARVITYQASGGSNTITVSNAPVYFVVNAFGPMGIYSALLNISASSSAPVTNTGPQFEQVGWSGFYSFTNAGINYLTVTFTNAIVDINGSGGSGSMFDTANTNAVTYTSDILNLAGLSTKDFALGFSAVTPPYQIGQDGYGNPFTSNVAGTFAGATVPEPSSWAMMVIGVGMVGFAVRARRAAVSTVSA